MLDNWLPTCLLAAILSVSFWFLKRSLKLAEGEEVEGLGIETNPLTFSLQNVRTMKYPNFPSSWQREMKRAKIPAWGSQHIIGLVLNNTTLVLKWNLNSVSILVCEIKYKERRCVFGIIKCDFKSWTNNKYED